MVVFLSLTTPLVIIRIYTRYFINRRLWWDDYTCILSWVGLFGFAGIMFRTLKYGNGVDYWNVSKADAGRFAELFATIEIVARISMFLTKLSILLLFLRIFVPARMGKTKLYYSSWIVIWFNLLYCIALVLVVILQCVGKPNVPRGECIDTFALLITASLINVLTDLVMLIIPFRSVWELQMPTRRKIGLSLVFAFGMLALASSVARLGFQVVHAKDPNRTKVLITVALLAMAEQAIGIIVGCMPALPAFFHHINPSRQSKSSTPGRGDWRSSGTGRLGYWKAESMRVAANDPYLLSTECRELDDVENHRSISYKTNGTMTTIQGGLQNSPILSQKVECLHDNPNTHAVVSRSVQVESHPRLFQEDPASPQQARITK